MNPIIPIFVALPLAAAFLIMIFGMLIRNLHHFISSIVTFLLVILSIYAFLSLNNGSNIYKVGGWEPVNKIPVAIYMVLDGFSVIMLCIINLIGFLSAFYSVSYIRRYTAQNNYYALLCLMIAGMNGVVLSGDLFNLFVFLEISVISSYALVAFGIGKNELEASFKYQVLGWLASMLILLGISLIYWKTKTLNIADVKQVLSIEHSKAFYIFVQILLITGFGLKAAIIPFHAWLPDAHSSAPSPISAMLSGVLIKAVGIYVIIRLSFNMFLVTEDIAILITTLGTLSMVIGVFLALGQWDIKRLLAYSSISQIGYVVLAIGMGMILISRGEKSDIASLAFAGGFFHLINHAVFKALLFLNAGAIEYRTGIRDMKKMGGLSTVMPVTSSTSFAASMAISGIPPFNGFFSKLIIIIAAINGGFYLLAFLAVLVGILTIATFMKFQRYAFQNKEENMVSKEIREVPFPMIFSMAVLALLCLALSLLAFPGIRDAVLSPAIDTLMQTDIYTLKIIGN